MIPALLLIDPRLHDVTKGNFWELYDIEGFRIDESLYVPYSVVYRAVQERIYRAVTTDLEFANTLRRNNIRVFIGVCRGELWRFLYSKDVRTLLDILRNSNKGRCSASSVFSVRLSIQHEREVAAALKQVHYIQMAKDIQREVDRKFIKTVNKILEESDNGPVDTP